MKRIEQRDQVAFVELYQNCAASINARARHIVRDHGMAEEICQDVMLFAWNQAGQYDSTRASVLTWLLTVTEFRSIDRVRSESRIRAGADRQQASGPSRSRAFDDPAQVQLEIDLRSRQVRRAISNLAPVHSHLIDMAYFQGMSQSQISRQTGVALGTVKSRTYVVLRQLRSDLVPILA